MKALYKTTDTTFMTTLMSDKIITVIQGTSESKIITVIQGKTTRIIKPLRSVRNIKLAA